MRNTKTGFTLVELIVVITILAILGTIAFISLGSYTADARNAKRLDGISKLATAIDNDQLSGKSLLAYVADSANAVTGVSVAGTAGTATDYQAGNINPTALNVKAEQFEDPSQTDELYRIGVSTRAGGVYELAAKLEEGSTSRASVKGNYSPRGTTSATATAGTNSVVLTNVTDINFFKVGDTTDNGVVTAISPDGLTVTVDGTPGASIALSAAESTGLVGTDGGVAVVNDDITNFPY